MNESRKRMTAKRKLEVYLETRQKDANVGEILRRDGLHVNDLRRIETLVEHAAIDALKGRTSRTGVGAHDGQEYAELVAELAQKEKALADLTVEYTLLKKNERSGGKAPSTGLISMANGGRS